MDASLPQPTHQDLEAYLKDPESWAAVSISLQRIARSIVHDASGAEDVVQSAWLEILERKQTSKGLGWIRKLVQSRSIDVHRQRRRSETQIEPSALKNVVTDDPSVRSKLGIQRVVLEAVEALQEPYRSTVYLRYFEGLGPQSISAQLNIPEKTVKTRLTRAHNQLRERLQTSYQDQNGSWTPAVLAFAGLPQPPTSMALASVAAPLFMKKVTLVLCTLLIGWWAIEFFSASTIEPTDPIDSGEVLVSSKMPSEPTTEFLQGPENPRDPLPTAAPQESPAHSSPLAFGSLHVLVKRSNGTPASNVHVIATRKAESNHAKTKHRTQSDTAGLAEFAKLPEGTYQLSSDRHDKQPKNSVEIQIDKAATHTLTLPEGVLVRGTVQDQAGRPLAGASVWLTSNTPSWTGGAVVTDSDPSGHFEIEDVPMGQSIGALAPGYQRSALTDLDELDTSRKDVHVVLTLTAGGGTVFGQVTDEQGQPIPGADVVMGDNAGPFHMRPDQSVQETWKPQRVQTDQDGRYSVFGLPSGKVAVQARSLEHPLWSSALELQSGQRTECNIELSKGSVLFGNVTSVEGVRVGGTTILATHEPLPEFYLQGGQVDYDGAFSTPAALADAQGNFELPALAPGPMWLYALEPAKNPKNFFANIRYTKELLTIEAGKENEWNPVLSDGRVIEGQVLYQDGVPIEGVYVLLSCAEEADPRGFHCKDGHFRYMNLGKGPYSVRVQMWDLPEGHLEPHMEGIFPGGAPVDVVATFDAPKVIEPAKVQVHFVDSGERTFDNASVLLELVDGYSRIYGTKENGSWTFTLDTPGLYRPLALAAKRIIGSGPAFEVQGGETLTLPDLVSGPGGTLILDIQRPQSPSPEGLKGYLRKDPSKYAEVLELSAASELRIDNLEPGTGELSFNGTNVMQLTVPFKVIAGAETRVAVHLTAAVPVAYHVQWPIEEATGTMTIEFTNRATGALVADYEVDDLTQLNSPVHWNAFLPMGAYQFQVMKNGVVYYKEEFDVTSLNPKEAPVLGKK